MIMLPPLATHCFLDPNRPRYWGSAWRVHPLVSEPSVIHTRNVDGSLLRSEPSIIQTLSVDGSTPDARTIRDLGPQRGRFRSGLRTFRDIDLQRGWFNHWYPYLPRYRPPPWMVQPLVSEPSAIQTLSMDGSALDPEPSMISTPSVEGSPHRH